MTLQKGDRGALAILAVVVVGFLTGLSLLVYILATGL